MKNISQSGLSLIKRFEGCRLTAYDDLQPHLILKPNTPIKGTLTIGWGHTGGVYIGQTITQDEADNWLKVDLAKYVAATNNPFNVPFTLELNQNQFDALVSFCYNAGPGNLRNLCLKRSISSVADAFLRYNRSKGSELVGLTNRRKAEQKLFNTAMEVIKMSDKYNENDIINLEKSNEILSSQISDLKVIIAALVKRINKLEDKVTDIPAPQWILDEFPNASDSLSQKTGTYDFWRSYLLILRNSK